jgi:RNA polymerase sigma-70 factor (sigma-E family)
VPKGGYESYVEFVSARQSALVRAATLISGDPELAQDLVQDALVKLALRWEKVRDGYPEAYVRRMLYRDAVSWRRRFRRERLGVTADLRLPDPADETDARLALRTALSTLTTKQRAVLVLRFYEDLSERQTAELLGIGIGTVKSQTYAALSRLRVHAPGLDTLLIEEKTSD